VERYRTAERVPRATGSGNPLLPSKSVNLSTQILFLPKRLPRRAFNRNALSEAAIKNCRARDRRARVFSIFHHDGLPFKP
jgi:hypothetical protein